MVWNMLLRKFAFFAAILLVFIGRNLMAADEPFAGPEPRAPESQAPAPEETPAPESHSLAPEKVPAPALETAAPALVYYEGLSASWLTRITKQTGRSNFVLEDFMPGLYFGMTLTNIKYLSPMIRLTAYYPLQSTFNKIPQPAKTPLHFGVDFFGGPAFHINIRKYAGFQIAPGLHLLFLNSDRWNYFNLGIAGLAGLEFPLTRNWTILVNGMASLDNGNLGGNRLLEPFDIVYQYQVDIGVRYSKKRSNTFSYIRQ
jgi:hypothetical protein